MKIIEKLALNWKLSAIAVVGFAIWSGFVWDRPFNWNGPDPSPLLLTIPSMISFSLIGCIQFWMRRIIDAQR